VHKLFLDNIVLVVYMGYMTKHTYIYNPSLVIMVGPSGSGKSTFADRHFEQREIVSSDDIREWLTGDFRRQDKNRQVFEEFHRRIDARLGANQRAVADATNLRNADRKAIVSIGKRHGVPIYYVVVNRTMGEKVSTGGWRNDVISKGVTLLERHENAFISNQNAILSGDGDRSITVIDTRNTDQTLSVANALPRDKTLALENLQQRGYNKVRVIPDVHGNLPGLVSVLGTVSDDTYLLFLGDIVDYGDKSWECVNIVYQVLASGRGSMARGNHDAKMSRYFTQMMERGEFNGHITHGMGVSVEQISALPREKFLEKARDWIVIAGYVFLGWFAYTYIYKTDEEEVLVAKGDKDVYEKENDDIKQWTIEEEEVVRKRLEYQKVRP